VALPKGSAAVTLLKRSTNGSDWRQEGQTVNVNNARESSTQLNNLPPGDYSLFVWESPNEIEYLNPDVFSQIPIPRTNRYHSRRRNHPRFRKNHPGSPPHRPYFTPLRFWRVYDYLIAYAPDERPLWVVAVMHGHRSPRVMAAILRGREEKP
jgi:hypothetical protein